MISPYSDKRRDAQVEAANYLRRRADKAHHRAKLLEQAISWQRKRIEILEEQNENLVVAIQQGAK